MAKFKALRALKQMTSFKSRTYRAQEGFLEIEEKEAIAYFSQNPNWELVKEAEPKKEVKKEIKKEDKK